jgi:hypothetical protein
VNELANQKYVYQKINGWKIYHLATGMDDIIDMEVGIGSLLICGSGPKNLPPWETGYGSAGSNLCHHTGRIFFYISSFSFQTYCRFKNIFFLIVTDQDQSKDGLFLPISWLLDPDQYYRYGSKSGRTK